MKKEKVYLQHGDVILYEVDSIPDGAKPIKIVDGFVVEKGEGVHTHVLENVNDVEGYMKDGVLYLKVNGGASINHEEHNVKTLEPGKILRKEIENEFDYEDMESRKTQD